jgi:hypothetical protein
VPPADGGGGIEVYDLGAGFPGCPKSAPQDSVLEPEVQGCKIEGPLGCEQCLDHSWLVAATHLDLRLRPEPLGGKHLSVPGKG